MQDVPDYAPLCAAPDRTPHRPRIPFPRGACDTHAHIFGPAAQFPYAAERIYTPPDSTWADYCALLRTLGVERAVLVQPSVYGTDNAAMLSALRTAGPGLRAVAVVQEDIAAGELESLNQAGVLRAIARRVAPFGWHIELLINLDHVEGFAATLADLPVPIVIGHMGYPRDGVRAFMESPAFADLMRLLDGGRCWIKLTSPYRISPRPLPYDDVDALAQTLAKAAPERMLWGTDWPHVMLKGRMPNDGDLCDLIERWMPDATARTCILVDNPAELYGFAEGGRIGR